MNAPTSKSPQALQPPAGERDFPFVVKLLDDESPKVRRKAWEVLEAHLEIWEDRLAAAAPVLSPEVRGRIVLLREERMQAACFGEWSRLLLEPDGFDRLEKSLALLSRYPSGYLALRPARYPSLEEELDGLASEFSLSGHPKSAEDLSRFLFVEKGFKGASRNYFDPRNSDLLHVIDSKEGLPLSLCLLFILVGERVGLGIHGCDVPSHFLARAEEDGHERVFDCFNGGRCLAPAEVEELGDRHGPEFQVLLRTPASPKAILGRILRNLAQAYRKEEQPLRVEFAEALLALI